VTWPPMNPLAPVTRTRDGIFRDSDMDEVGLLDAQSMAIRGLTARGQEAYRNPTTCIVHRVVIGGLCKAALSRRDQFYWGSQSSTPDYRRPPKLPIDSVFVPRHTLKAPVSGPLHECFIPMNSLTSAPERDLRSELKLPRNRCDRCRQRNTICPGGIPCRPCRRNKA